MAKRQPVTPHRSGVVNGGFQTKPDITKRRADMKYRINTTSTTASGVVPISGATKYPAQPEIYFTREAWVKQCHLVKKCSKEVGWFALVDYCEDDNSFTITELVIPNQEVTAAETDIGKEDLADAAMELIEQGKDTSKMYAWFHSHVNMGVSPSGQDEFQVEEFLEDLADQPEVPAFIRGIQNKAGDLKLDVYYIQHGVAYQNLDFYVIHDDDPQWLVDIENTIKDKVQEKTFHNTYTQYGGFGGNRQQAGKSHAGNQSATRNGGGSWGYEDGFRDYDYYGGSVWDDPYDHIYDQPVEIDAPLDTEATLEGLVATEVSIEQYNEWELVYTSPGNIDVLVDKQGKLWVTDADGDSYEYDEYTQALGEVDGDTHNNALAKVQ